MYFSGRFDEDVSDFLLRDDVNVDGAQPRVEIRENIQYAAESA